MDRRRFLVASLAGALAATHAAAEQEARARRIALFHVGLDHVPPSLEPLRQELKTLGYVEGRNLILDWRNLPDEEAAREVAKEFVRNRSDLIVAFENHTIRAVKAATSEIPVVFVHATDPVESRFVKSMGRPGGNLTGFAGVGDVPAKWLQLFREVIPGLRRILILFNPRDPVAPRYLGEYRKAAPTLKLRLVEREVADQTDIERVFASLKRGEVDGVLHGSPDVRARFSLLLTRLALDHRLAFQAHRKEWVEQGALFSYSPDLASVGTLAARYIDRIFKGAKPAGLPVQELLQYRFVINLKTAKTLGLTIPSSVLLRADEVIE
jgi:putative tryptophan/tyrosine transport system substrate-binding protein